MDDRRIRVFDTTLRDGQQCPGAGMSFEKNLEYARLVFELGVDVLEAGFPSASKLDFQIVHAIAELARDSGPQIAGLCQLRDEQIDRTIEAVLPALPGKRAVLHTYVPVDPELMQASLGSRAADKDGIREDVYKFIKRGVDAGLEVEFSPEGYSRVGENFDFCSDLLRAAIEAGVSVINCPDTIGGAAPFQGEEYFVCKMRRHAEMMAAEYPDRSVIWSVHCHNDFGLAVINTLNAVFYGPARQVEGCFNGLGERAGNGALEQLILIIKHFAKDVDSEKPFYTTIKTQKIQELCDFVSANMLPSQAHWPIAGKNAARHSSGGHTNAILRNPLAYQPFDPAEIGKKITFVFGPLSGGNHARAIITERGYRCDDNEKSEIAQFIKELYHERRKGITDEELMEGYFLYRSPIDIDRFEYSKSANMSSVTFSGRFFDKKGEFTSKHEGQNSALAALKRAVEENFCPVEIRSHKSQSASHGYDAASISEIVIADEKGAEFTGTGKDHDIEISALKAFIDAVNRAYVEKHYRIATV